jgi:hypothetical protein
MLVNVTAMSLTLKSRANDLNTFISRRLGPVSGPLRRPGGRLGR